MHRGIVFDIVLVLWFTCMIETKWSMYTLPASRYTLDSYLYLFHTRVPNDVCLEFQYQYCSNEVCDKDTLECYIAFIFVIQVYWTLHIVRHLLFVARLHKNRNSEVKTCASRDCLTITILSYEHQIRFKESIVAKAGTTDCISHRNVSDPKLQLH